MMNITFRRFALVCMLVLLISGPANAEPGDDIVLQAKAAYDKNNAMALAAYVQQLKNQNHILEPYAEYWQMLLNLNDTDNQTILDFINANSEYPFADRLRGEYLKKLGQQQDWKAFASEYPNFHLDDAAVACYAAEASAENGDISLLASAKSLWMQPKEQPGSCSDLYDRMQAAKVLTEDDIMDRFRLALGEGRLALAKSIVKRSKNFEAVQYKQIDKANANPSLAINKKWLPIKGRIGREINLFALVRLSKSDSDQALSAFKKIENALTAEDKSYFYGKLAHQAALRQEPEALQWFQKVDSSTLSHDQLAWYARVALRDKNWPEVLKTIDKMDQSQADEGAWRYWKARALKATGRDREATPVLARLSTERHYYGWLAQEELEGLISSAPVYYKVTDEDVMEVSQTPAFRRVEALQRVDLRWEARSEWVHATSDFDDRHLLAAAEYASRKQWHDLAIITADKTTEMHNFALRYPTPYRDIMKTASNEQNVDEAWVYGITRQESRFMTNARSGVGATGLMQLMPTTAKWAAKRVGLPNYSNGMLQDLGTNITLGTYYLRYTLDTMNGQETMATAAYNAGPSRAKKWMADTPLEGAIYVETIPFTETRTYVQRVMANAHLYTQRLGLKAITLKQRLGTIPGRAGLTEANNVAESNTVDEQAQSEQKNAGE
jgi:soluble lytic murein transglycosylase